MNDLFSEFDPEQIAAIHALEERERAAAGQARAMRRKSVHQMRRAKAQAHLADILPARFESGESWHVISHGDIDALSYLSHAIADVSHFDHVLLSTWCIAKEDLLQIESWLDSGRIDRLDLCMGEIFPSQYGDEYELAMQLVERYEGVRLTVAKNHSKVTLAALEAEDYYLAIESSANVNTNPRIEQTAIHRDRDLYDFYRAFFTDLRSIDRASARLNAQKSQTSPAGA